MKQVIIGYCNQSHVFNKESSLLRAFYAFDPDIQLQVTIEKRKRIRTDNQNKYYWAVVLPMIGDYLGYFPSEVHDLMKRMFNPKGTPRDPEMVVGGTTTKMTTIQFNEYIEAIKQWAVQEHGILIPDPDEL